MYKTASAETLMRGTLQALSRASNKGMARPKLRQERREIDVCFFMDAWQTI